MNCCDDHGDCNQGRDCPVRVAKVGQRYPKYPEPVFVPYINWQLKALAKWMLLAILGWLVWVPLLYLLLRA
jgi:hypothetical protein